MNEEQFTLLLEYLDKVGVKLGIGVQGIWPWFVKQQYIQAVHSFVLFITSLIIFYFVVKFTQNRWNPDDGSYSIVRENHKEAYITVLVIICCASVFVLLGFIGDLAGIFNPQYYAFKDLIAMITPDIVKSE